MMGFDFRDVSLGCRAYNGRILKGEKEAREFICPFGII